MGKVGVILSGCGYLDGSEIQEAVLTLLFLDRAGAETVCMAPDADQKDIVDHITKKSAEGPRNVIIEAARIARGDIRNIKDVKEREIDAMIFPGGYGAVKNLCDFAEKGAGCSVDPDVERLVLGLHKAGKPMGFICIAPAIAAKVLGAYTPELTIGSDKGAAGALESMGAKHIVCAVDGIAVDKKNRIVSTPAYMLGPTVSRVAQGIEKTVNCVLEMMR